MKRLISCAAVLWLCVPSVGRADGPSHSDPNKFIPLWSDGETEKLYAEAIELLNKATEDVESLEKRKVDKKMLLVLKEVGVTHIMILQLQRRAKRLMLWSEPAGVDIMLRGRALNDRLNILIEKFRPIFSEAIKRAQPTLAGRCLKHKKLLADAKDPEKNENIEDLEERLNKVYDEQLESLGVWYPTATERSDNITPFDKAVLAVEKVSLAARQKEVDAAIAERRTKIAPDLMGLVKSLSEASNAVVQHGRATVEGKELAGPECLAHFGDRWQQAELAMWHALALDWARYTTGAGKDGAAQLAKAHANAKPSLLASFVNLIKSDASRAEEKDVPDLYARYLAAAAPLAVLIGDPGFTKQINEALEQLASKSEVLGKDIAAYRGATGDLLRWRARLSEAEVKRAREAFPTLTTTTLPNSMSLYEAAPRMIAEAEKPILAKAASWSNWMGAAKESLATGKYDSNWVFARVKLDPKSLGPAVARLKADLLVADGAPPLTLEAAMAAVEAERGDLVEVGGEISDYTIEGLLPMFAHLDQWGVARLGTIQEEPLGRFDPRDQIRFRLEFAPKWYRGRYFFVEGK